MYSRHVNFPYGAGLVSMHQLATLMDCNTFMGRLEEALTKGDGTEVAEQMLIQVAHKSVSRNWISFLK